MENTVIRERLTKLRQAMRRYKIDFYLIPTADFHNSEYVNDYFKVREFFSGFTGSNGTLVVSIWEAGLWTDGRYFVQAERELDGTGIKLFRMQEEGVPTVTEYLCEQMEEYYTLGFDGRVVDAALGEKLAEIQNKKKIRIVCDRDLAEGIWTDRPPFPCSRAEILPPDYCGESVSEKMERVRAKMREEGCGALFISKLDDLMWLFNIRGNDIPCNPVVMSFGFLSGKEASLFLQRGALQPEVVESMAEAGVQIRSYHSALPFLQNYLFQGGIRHDRGKIWYDEKNVSYSVHLLMKRYGDVLTKANPTEAMKAVKTPAEMEHIRHSYLLDSVAVTKFLYWIKHKNLEQDTVTEADAAGYLDTLRRDYKECMDLSFPTISAYGANAAMMHYEATPENCSRIEPEGMLLVDSGGQYLGGTTDVTRTIVMGKLGDKMKQHYTAVATGMLRLANAKFLYGCSGRNLDVLARGPLWDLDMDYKCGTGHGIGYMLNVHEGPHSIRWRFTPGAEETVLEEGMLVSDEPGVYLAGEYGIRIENVLEVKKGVKNGDGQFMEFAPLTWVPIDCEGIDPGQMPAKERLELNEYHRMVYDKISPFLNEAEREWLEAVTTGI